MSDNTPSVGFVAFGPADSSEYRAARAFADLPVLAGDPPLPPPETLRAKLLSRDVGTMRDRQRERLDGYICGCLRDIERATCERDRELYRHYLVGAVLGAQTMDVLSAEEAQAWIDRAWEASRA